MSERLHKGLSCEFSLGVRLTWVNPTKQCADNEKGRLSQDFRPSGWFGAQTRVLTSI
jgi:hypothetical protein